MDNHRSSSRPWLKTVAALAVVLLVVVSGCSGLNSIAGGNNAASAQGNGQANTLPPGVSSSNLTNISALAQAHQKELIESGYISGFEMRGQMSRAGRTRNLTMAQREVVEQNASRFLFQVQQQMNRRTTRMGVWSNESTTLLRQQRRGSATYRKMNGSSVRAQLGGEKMLEQYLRTGTFNVQTINRSSGSMRVTLKATEYTKPKGTKMPSAENVSSYQGTAVVDGQGRVQRMMVTIRYTGPKGGKATLLVRYALLKVGSVSVDRPSWVGQAVANTTGESSSTSGGHHGGSGGSGHH